MTAAGDARRQADDHALRAAPPTLRRQHRSGSHLLVSVWRFTRANVCSLDCVHLPGTPGDYSEIRLTYRMDTTVIDLYLMLDKIIQSSLPDAIRQRARELAIDAPDAPEAVTDQLREMAAQYSSTLVHTAPTTELYRLVELDVFRRHIADSSFARVDAGLFRRRVESEREPAAFLASIVPPNRVIAPALRSWLVDNPRVAGMTTRELHGALELSPDQRPPFVLFRCTAARMTSSGVEIRQPNALDAAAGGRTQWDPSGLKDGVEYIDRDVAIAAVEDILWKPA